MRAPVRLHASEAVVEKSAAAAVPRGFQTLGPPAVPITLALLGAIPFVHFSSMLAPSSSREEWVRAHNKVIRSLATLFGDDVDLSCLKVYEPTDAQRWLQTYGAVILSFMAGVNWGAVTARLPKGTGFLLYTASLLPAIAAWAAVNASPDGNPPRKGRDGANPSEQRSATLPVPQALRDVVSSDPASMLYPSPNGLLSLGFVTVLATDLVGCAAGVLPLWYGTYRLLLTAIVVRSLKNADRGMEGNNSEPLSPPGSGSDASA